MYIRALICYKITMLYIYYKVMQFSRVNVYWKIPYWILVVSPSFENEDWSKTSLITQNRIYFQVNIEEVKERYMQSNINIDFEDTGGDNRRWDFSSREKQRPKDVTE